MLAVLLIRDAANVLLLLMAVAAEPLAGGPFSTPGGWVVSAQSHNGAKGIAVERGGGNEGVSGARDVMVIREVLLHLKLMAQIGICVTGEMEVIRGENGSRNGRREYRSFA